MWLDFSLRESILKSLRFPRAATLMVPSSTRSAPIWWCCPWSWSTCSTSSSLLDSQAFWELWCYTSLTRYVAYCAYFACLSILLTIPLSTPTEWAVCCVCHVPRDESSSAVRTEARHSPPRMLLHSGGGGQKVSDSEAAAKPAGQELYCNFLPSIKNCCPVLSVI